MHVEHGDGQAKFWLHGPRLVYSFRMPRMVLRRAEVMVAQNRDAFLEQWYEYFGP